MLIKDIKKNIAKYDKLKGYGRWYFWGERYDVTYLKEFIKDKRDNKNVSFMKFHEWLQDYKSPSYLFYKNDRYSTPRNTTFSDANASMRVIFRPWFDELSDRKKNKVAHDNEESYERYCDKHRNVYYNNSPIIHIPR